MANAVLSASGLKLGYGETPVVDDVAFELARGDVFAVVGHNGSGKSTLIKTILGALPPLYGQLTWGRSNGASGHERPGTIAYLGQQTEFDNRFPIRVRDLAAMDPNLLGRFVMPQSRVHPGLARLAREELDRHRPKQMQRHGRR